MSKADEVARLKDQIAEQQRHIDTMKHIMSNCYSDEGYRIYSQRLNQFISEHNRLERELEKLVS